MHGNIHKGIPKGKDREQLAKVTGEIHLYSNLEEIREKRM